MAWKAVAALLFVLCLCDWSGAEDLDLSQQFLLLSTHRSSTLVKELRKATDSGFRLLFAATAGSGSGVGEGLPQAFTERNQLILEKTTSGSESIDHVFLELRGQSLADSAAFLESGMNEAAAKGYRFVPRTFLDLMEKRATDSSPPLKYRILAGSSKHLQEEICKAGQEGFRFLDLVDNVVVMEKSSVPSQAPGNAVDAQPGRGAGCPFLVIGTRTEGALRKEIAAGVAGGYRVVSASCPGEIIVVMEEAAPDAGSREYVILDSMRTGKLERDIKEAAGRGFHAVPRTFITYSITNVAILEKSSSTTDIYEYMILESQKSATLQKKLSDAAEQGFRPVAMNGSRLMLVERIRP